MEFLFLAIGVVLLLKGADWLVSGAGSIARGFGITPLVIGLTIVAFGTSAPELVVNLLAAVQGNTDIAIGNIVGSNIVNVLLILGVSAAIYPLTVKSTTVWKEIPLALLAALVLAVAASDVFFNGATASVISRSDGLIFLGFFAVFMYYTFGIAKQGGDEPEQEETKRYSKLRSVGMTIVGIGALVLGGKLLVDAAVSLATTFGMSEAVIGLTVVAIGTSLPELATSAVAAWKKQADIAIGNVVGSNIFNIFWILGVSSLIKPLPFSAANAFDLYVLIGTSFLLFLALFVGRKHLLERWQGYVFIGLYIAYVTALLV